MTLDEMPTIFYHEIKVLLKTIDLQLYKQYQDRRVNSIYLDTNDFKSYTDSNSGINERNKIASSLRSHSKDATSKKSLEITDVNLETVNNFIQENNPDIFIHGHTHRPKIHQHDSTKRVVLGDWDKYGWYLSIEENSLNLKEFKI